ALHGPPRWAAPGRPPSETSARYDVALFPLRLRNAVPPRKERADPRDAVLQTGSTQSPSIDGSSLRTFEVGRAQPRNAGRPRNRETPTRRSQWAAVSSGDSMRNHLVREDRPGAATGETAALLRALGQPLHILKFAFRSGHYHFGLFARPDGGLA